MFLKFNFHNYYDHIDIPKKIKNSSKILQAIKKQRMREAFTTKPSSYSFRILLALLFVEITYIKFCKQWWGVFHKQCTGSSQKNIIRGIQLPAKYWTKKAGVSHRISYSCKDIIMRQNYQQQFQTEFTSYSCKNICRRVK